MQVFLLWLLASVSLIAQQPAGRGAGPAPTYKNLKALAATSDVPFIMPAQPRRRSEGEHRDRRVAGLSRAEIHLQGAVDTTKLSAER